MAAPLACSPGLSYYQNPLTSAIPIESGAPTFGPSGLSYSAGWKSETLTNILTATFSMKIIMGAFTHTPGETRQFAFFNQAAVDTQIAAFSVSGGGGGFLSLSTISGPPLAQIAAPASPFSVEFVYTFISGFDWNYAINVNDLLIYSGGPFGLNGGNPTGIAIGNGGTNASTTVRDVEIVGQGLPTPCPAGSGFMMPVFVPGMA